MTNENILLHIRIFYEPNAHLPHIQIRFGSGSEISLLKERQGRILELELLGYIYTCSRSEVKVF